MSLTDSDQYLATLKRSSRLAATLTAMGVLLSATGVGLGVWKLSQTSASLKSGERNISDLTKTAKVYGERVKQAEEFIEGKRDRVVLSSPDWPESDFKPTVKYEREAWGFTFTVGMEVTPTVRSRVMGAKYILDPKEFGSREFDGKGSFFEATVDVPYCRSTATASISLADGQTVRIAFDWCRIAGWDNVVHYDVSSLGGIAHFSEKCTAPKALLAFVQEDLANRIGPVQLLRQIYRVDRRWQPEAGSPAVTFRVLRSERDRNQLAIVAECRTARICADLAAAYRELAGGMMPELHCGAIPLLTSDEANLDSLPKGSWAQEMLTPRSGWERCFRLAACEIGLRGRSQRYSGSKCMSGTIAAKAIECAAASDCESVLRCAGQEP